MTAEQRRIRVNEYNRKRYRNLHPHFRERRPNGSPITKGFILSRVRIDFITRCWVWKKSKSRGYGRIWDGLKFVQAHRAAYELFKDKIPPHLFACHKCDNRACCNPDHVFIGTQTDNMRDASNKHRTKAPNRKLSADDAMAVRVSTLTGARLAKIYGVSRAAISLIRSGKTYARAS